MKVNKNLKLVSKSKNIDKNEFILRLQNNYALDVEYEYIEKGVPYFLSYSLYRDITNKETYNKKIFCLVIEEGKKPPEIGYKEDFSKRDLLLEFKSIPEAIEYLLKNEYFKISDWYYQRRTVKWSK